MNKEEYYAISDDQPINHVDKVCYHYLYKLVNALCLLPSITHMHITEILHLHFITAEG